MSVESHGFVFCFFSNRKKSQQFIKLLFEANVSHTSIFFSSLFSSGLDMNCIATTLKCSIRHYRRQISQKQKSDRGVASFRSCDRSLDGRRVGRFVSQANEKERLLCSRRQYNNQVQRSHKGAVSVQMHQEEAIYIFIYIYIWFPLLRQKEQKREWRLISCEKNFNTLYQLCYNCATTNERRRLTP